MSFFFKGEKKVDSLDSLLLKRFYPKACTRPIQIKENLFDKFMWSDEGRAQHFLNHCRESIQEQKQNVKYNKKLINLMSHWQPSYHSIVRTKSDYHRYISFWNTIINIYLKSFNDILSKKC